MKKKINKLQLKKTVVTILNNETRKVPGQQGFIGTQPLASCRIVCIASRNCPTTI